MDYLGVILTFGAGLLIFFGMMYLGSVLNRPEKNEAPEMKSEKEKAS